MKKLMSFLLFVVLSVSLVSCSGGTIDSDKAVEKIEKHLISSNIIVKEDDYLKTAEDDLILEWDKEFIKEETIEEKQCYVVNLFFSDIEIEEVAGMRFGTFAVSNDGKTFYMIDEEITDSDVWKEI